MRWVLLLLAMTSFAHADTRTQFAAKLARVKVGMTADQVTKILGAPDDIKTEKDPGGIAAARTVEVWRYGASGHLKAATRGAVHVQADRKVQYVFGAKGKPYTGVPEPELQRLMQLLDDVPSYNDLLDARALVRAVNALHPLGKDKALDVIGEYLRVTSWLDDPGREGVFLVLRALFDPPMPPMMVGAPTLAADDKKFPRHPLIIVGDVPLEIVGGYVLGGHPEQPEDDVAAFRKQGKLRAAPLTPSPAMLDELEAVLQKTPELDKAYVIDQALRFFGTVYRPANRTVDSWLPDIKSWQVHRVAVAKIKPVWNAKTQQMEDKGSVLPPLPGPSQRVWWDLGLAGATKSRVTFERLSDDLVHVELRVEGPGAVDSLRILDGAKVMATIATAKNTVSTQRLTLPRGQSIRLELASGTQGPALTP